MRKILFIATLALMGCGTLDGPSAESLSNYKGWMISDTHENPDVVILEKDGKIKYVMTTAYWMSKYKVGDTIK